MDQREEVTVMAADDQGEVHFQVDVGGLNEKDIRSSIAAAQGCLFIRTNTTLSCFGKVPQ